MRSVPLLAVFAVAPVFLFAAAAPGSSPPAAERLPAVETPSAGEVEEVLPEGARLSGRELYDRFIKNRRRLRSIFQRGRILSSDPGGNPQRTDFWFHWKDYRDENDDAVDGVLSKTLFKVTGPREMRHTGYLYIEHDGEEDAQFLYSPHRGRTSRVSVKGQNVAGTDFSFDDFLLNLDDIEDAAYERHDDRTIDGVECYVVEARMKPSARSPYTRALVFLEKDHYVPLVTRYWDDAAVEVKKLTSPDEAIREFEGAWLPTETTVTDLLEGTTSTLYVDELEPNPELDDRMFSTSSLEFRP
jgi:hypothetical protein